MRADERLHDLQASRRCRFETSFVRRGDLSTAALLVIPRLAAAWRSGSPPAFNGWRRGGWNLPLFSPPPDRRHLQRRHSDGRCRGLSLVGRFLQLGISVGENDCSASFALLTAAAWLPVISVARRSDSKRPALLYGLLLLLEASYLAIFACDNAVWLCASLELNSVLLYLLTTGWSEQASEGLAKKMLLTNLAADVAILIGLMGVVIASARISGAEPNAIPRLTYSLSEITRELPHVTTDDISAQEYWKHAQRSLLTLLVLGAAIKAPLVPFHAWFAAVVAEGPLCVGIALVGPGLRVGLYLLARFIGPLVRGLGRSGRPDCRLSGPRRASSKVC